MAANVTIDLSTIDWASVGLGVVSDQKIAEKLGVCRETVRRIRVKLGVQPICKPYVIDWDKQPLGLATDREIARKLKCSPDVVRDARHKRGIPALGGPCVPNNIDWSTVTDLGVVSDTKIAKRLGVDKNVVRHARERLHIPSWLAASVNWSEVPVGTLPDVDLAEIFGVSPKRVSYRRRVLGIPALKTQYLTSEGVATSSRPEALIDLYWHENNIPHQFQVPVGKYLADWVIHETTIVEYAGCIKHFQFGERYAARLREKLEFYKNQGFDTLVIYPDNLSDYSPKQSPTFTGDLVSGDVNWSQQPWGEMPDCELAKLLGTHTSRVRSWRVKIGVPKFVPEKRDWSLVPLGLKYDSEIAKDLGVCTKLVCNARRKLNIASYQDTLWKK